MNLFADKALSCIGQTHFILAMIDLGGGCGYRNCATWINGTLQVPLGLMLTNFTRRAPISSETTDKQVFTNTGTYHCLNVIVLLIFTSIRYVCHGFFCIYEGRKL